MSFTKLQKGLITTDSYLGVLFYQKKDNNFIKTFNHNCGANLTMVE